MNLPRWTAVGLLLALGSQPAAGVSAPSIAAPRLVLQGVTVVDVRDGHLAPDRAVVIEGGRIVRIVPADAPAEGGQAQVVDARGKFLVPGYVDMHAHPLNAPDPTDNLKLMLAAGITGYRQMSGSPQLLEARRAGRLEYPAGPRLLALSGTILTDNLTPTAEAAAAEVRRQQAQGADFIKSVGLSRASFLASLKEAKRIGIPYTGHIHNDVDVRETAGMRSIEHLGALEAMLLSCSKDEAAIRKSIAEMEVQPPQAGPGPADMAEALARFIANPLLATPPAQFAVQARVLETYDEARCRDLAGWFVAEGTWQVPTLLRLRTMAIPDDPIYRNDPNLRFVPPATREMWVGLAEQFASQVAPADQAMLRRFFDLQLKVTRLFQDEGVPMLAGSDTGGSQWVIPGVSLHQDFDLFAQAGLTPLQVLQIGTLNAARFLGREETMGTVEENRDADLVLLDGNPVGDVANLHRIAGVVRGGVYYPEPALREMRESTVKR